MLVKALLTRVLAPLVYGADVESEAAPVVGWDVHVHINCLTHGVDSPYHTVTELSSNLYHWLLLTHTHYRMSPRVSGVWALPSCHHTPRTCHHYSATGHWSPRSRARCRCSWRGWSNQTWSNQHFTTINTCDHILIITIIATIRWILIRILLPLIVSTMVLDRISTTSWMKVYNNLEIRQSSFKDNIIVLFLHKNIILKYYLWPSEIEVEQLEIVDPID